MVNDYYNIKYSKTMQFISPSCHLITLLQRLSGHIHRSCYSPLG
jgi:hypothetical protein